VEASATAPGTPPLPPLLLRERVLLLGALALAIGLSWAYLGWMAKDMAVAAGATLAHCAAMPGMSSSSPAYLAWLVVMWGVMAVAMMLPTALPLVLLFGRFWRARNPGAGAGGATAQLVFGYLAAWFAFGAAASVLQLGLERAGAVTPAMGELRSAAAGGATLVLAGLFQLTPLKAACLSRCRSPLMFVMTRWRGGPGGSFLMGLDHGVFCLGCCWALMLVMFVAGVMNFAWMAALTVLMGLEKVVRRGELLARAAGVALVAAGVWLMLARFS
jgi:predicted metal-binding membrane protein